LAASDFFNHHHKIVVNLEPHFHISPLAGLTDRDQRLPLAEFECEHGHLATDPNVKCKCFNKETAFEIKKKGKRSTKRV